MNWINTWADASIISLILLSGFLSFLNGFIREMFSFLAWLLSFIIALIFVDELVSLLTTLIPFMDLCISISLLTLFFINFVILEWISYLILNSIGPTPLSISERMVGVFFGFTRGGVIVILLIMLGGLTQLPSSTWWQESSWIQYFKPLVIYLRSQLPLNIATQFNFEPPPEFQLPSF